MTVLSHKQDISCMIYIMFKDEYCDLHDSEDLKIG